MEEIRISLQEVANSASALRNYNNSIQETFDYVRRVMSDLNSYWSSEASVAIANKFNLFTKRLIEENETIESYAKFLDYTVSTYETYESTATSNAEIFS